MSSPIWGEAADFVEEVLALECGDGWDRDPVDIPEVLEWIQSFP
jgi:hypothetical protein